MMVIYVLEVHMYIMKSKNRLISEMLNHVVSYAGNKVKKDLLLRVSQTQKTKKIITCNGCKI